MDSDGLGWTRTAWSRTVDKRRRLKDSDGDADTKEAGARVGMRTESSGCVPCWVTVPRLAPGGSVVSVAGATCSGSRLGPSAPKATADGSGRDAAGWVSFQRRGLQLTERAKGLYVCSWRRYLDADSQRKCKAHADYGAADAPNRRRCLDADGACAGARRRTRARSGPGYRVRPHDARRRRRR